jgi:L-fuconolactonase
MLIIDTHAHIYSPDEKKYPPIEKPLRPPGGKGSLEDLRKESRANGVRAVCAIQTSTFYRFDNRYICNSTKANPDWVAGVCTLNPDDPHSPDQLRQFVHDYGIKGMRSIPARDGMLDHPGVRSLWKTALELGIVINVLIGRNKAEEAHRLLGEFSDLPVVLDHCLNLKAGPELDATLMAVLHLGRRKNLHAKLTFIPTGSATGYPCRDMYDACLKVIGAFGPERCIWGSDFPCELWTPKVSYAEHLRIFTHDLPLEDGARKQILGETANRLWFAGKLKAEEQPA